MTKLNPNVDMAKLVPPEGQRMFFVEARVTFIWSLPEESDPGVIVGSSEETLAKEFLSAKVINVTPIDKQFN